MSMIICPKCGKEFSDRAFACPQCGYKIEKQELSKMITCEECGIEYDEKYDACPNCGCPKPIIEVNEVPQKVEVTKVAFNKKKVVTIIIIFMVLAAFVLTGLLIKNKMDRDNIKKAENEYYSNLEKATMLMLSGCADAEASAGLIHDVWENAIYEENDEETDKYTKPDGVFVSDFNDALFNLQTDSSFSADIDKISDNQKNVQKILKELKNPPEKYSEAYSDLREFYDVYLEFTNLAINPNGSLKSYTQDYNKLDSDAMSKYDKMKLHLEE